MLAHSAASANDPEDDPRLTGELGSLDAIKPISID
jgi:hypothetical protein